MVYFAIKEARQGRKMQLERQMIGMAEEKKQQLRRHLEHEEVSPYLLATCLPGRNIYRQGNISMKHHCWWKS